MSYILDALKKSEEERQRGAVPKLTTRLIVEAGTQRRMWPWVIGGALLANAAVLGVFLLPSDEPPADARQETAAETSEANPAEPTASAESTTAPAPSPPAQPESKAAQPESKVAQPEPKVAQPEPKVAQPESKVEALAEAKPEAEAPAATTQAAEPPTAKPEPRAAEPLPKVILPPRQAAVPAPVKAAPKETEVAAATRTPEPTAAMTPERRRPSPIQSVPQPEPTPPEPTPVVAAPKSEPAKPEPVKVEPEPPAPKKTVVTAAPPVKPVPKPKPSAPKIIRPPVAVKAVSADASDSGYAVAYYNRGWGYAGKRLFDQAVSDYTQAIRLDKEYADAYFARGWVYEKRDKMDLALKDYTRAIEIKPNYALAYNNRGVLQLHRSLYDEAADDFATAFTLADKNLRPYILLWLHLSRIRSGGDGKPELIEYAKKLDLRHWPGVVVSMFLGEASAETVIAATKDEDSGKQKEKECVAFYFLGQRKLLEGDLDGAREFFLRTVKTGVTSYVQYGAAQEELRRMGAS